MHFEQSILSSSFFLIGGGTEADFIDKDESDVPVEPMDDFLVTGAFRVDFRVDFLEPPDEVRLDFFADEEVVRLDSCCCVALRALKKRLKIFMVDAVCLDR
mmetsp:Transcript_4767/g.12115  ORF Transcript_4767/g.12115 Transcript_4767/m.12115 type:complete len:101 (+) Transcript_4767:1221-1523(+)